MSSPERANDKPRKKPSVADEILEGLREIAEALESGEDLAKRFRVTRYYLPADTFDARKVKRLRKRLRADQIAFARFVGVSLKTLQSWESGASSPSPVANRFMAEMERNPDYWVKRFKEALVLK